MSGFAPSARAASLLPERTLLVITVTAVLLGCWLRLGSPLELEYKADEKLMFEFSQTVGTTAPWPGVGMPSGAGGVPNPGLSVWIFAGFAKLTGAATPVALARCVQVLNSIALVALAAFAFSRTGLERRTCLWAASLAALSPTAILVQRKIWAQSVLPLFCVLMLLAWWQRRRFWGAFAWSALLLCAAQIHMSGFIFLLALTAWTAVFWRESMNWRGWLAGGLVGSISAVPWLRATLFNSASSGGHAPGLLHIFGPEFWRLWLAEGFGLTLSHNLGGDLTAFLRGPVLAGQSTGLIGIAFYTLTALLAFFVCQWVGSLWPRRVRLKETFAEIGATRSESTFLIHGALIAYGITLSLPELGLYPHYLLIAFPLPYWWLSSLALSPNCSWRAFNERCLLAALILNLGVSVGLFAFLREHGGAPHGDFGVSWHAQEDARSRK